jgi:uncharacterized membrane protein YbhN (UPF0104 family)
MRMQRSWLATGLTLLVIALVLLALREKISLLSSTSFQRAIKTISVHRFAFAVACTIAYYCVIVGYDALAFRTMHLPATKRSIALASFVSFAYSNTIGFGAVTNASLRYHMHKHAGMTLKDSTKVVGFYTLTLLLGVLCVGSVVFLWSSVKVPLSLHLPFRTLQPIGWISLALLGIYIWLLTRSGKQLKIWKWTLPKLPLRVVLLQVLLASADWLLSGAAAYAILPHAPVVPFLEFMSIYMLAQLAGMFSQVPGGIGVFETVMLVLLPKRASAAATVGALLAFRMVFYVAPFILATLLLGRFEWRQRRSPEDVR